MTKYDDVNDADRLSLDPVMRWIVGGHAVTKQAASTSQLGCFETEVLATEVIIPIKSGPQPIVTAQGRIRGRISVVLQFSASGRNHLGNPGFNKQGFVTWCARRTS